MKRMKRMKRQRFGLWLVALSVTLCGVVPSRAAERAQEQRAQGQESATQALPLRDVVLFSSGVGYFQRIGRVSGNAAVNLSFRAEQVNDILKSLVLFDATGNVRPVTYTTKDSIGRRLRSAGMAINGSISLGTLLRQFQGARVRLDTKSGAIEGRILSVSLKTVPVPGKDGGVLQVEVVNLMTRSGLRAVSLDEVRQVRLLDERLDRELRESLELLSTGLDDQRRTVELHFDGNNAREVRAGYLQEMPIWKTSYRLVLDKEQKPYLQGWGIVENTTDEDWKDVRLSLVSGRPVSFIQDLYQPLYVPRPVVQAQLIGSPTPQTYGETLRAADADGGEVMGRVEALARRPAPDATRSMAGGGFGGGAAGAPLPPALAGDGVVDGQLQYEERRKDMGISATQLAQSVASQAQGTERGDLFEYAIRQPISLPKQQAAMVPIVTENIDGERLSIYDVDASARNALNGFRLKNSTGLHLSGGPITVIQDGAYAGDAQITNLQPGEDRLISYAVDLDLVADHKEPFYRQDTVSITARSGVMTITHKQRREQVYTLRNKSDEDKTVLVLQNIEPEFTVVEPAATALAEKTAEEYRFKVALPAKKTTELKVVSERPVLQSIALFDADINLLVEYARNTQVSPTLRAALEQLVQRRRAIAELQARRGALEAELQAIDQEQTRIRQNMAQLDRNNPLYQQYVKKLTDQEARIEQLRAEVAKLREAEAAAQKELREFVDKLTIE